MPSLVIANIFSIVVLLVVIAGILSKYTSTNSSKALLCVCIAAIICDVGDALTYSIAGPMLPDALNMAIYIVAYTFGNIFLIFFANYWYTYIDGKHKLNRAFAFVPILLLTFCFVYSLVLFLTGRVLTVKNGVTTVVEGIPVFINIIQGVVLIYFTLGAIFERKYIGIKAVSFLGGVGILPFFTIFLSVKFHITDYSYPVTSIAMLLAYILLDSQLSHEKELQYQQNLLERNQELERINKEQIEQVKKITALNSELEEAKKNAEAANRAKTTFLNNMSHDIRTPMNAILGYTNLMESSLENKEKVTDYMSKIKTSGEYLLTIINNVLDIAKIDSGKVVLDEDVNDLLSPENTVVPMVAVQVKEKNLKLEMKTDIVHRYVYADMVKTKQIVLNILSNAVKYTPEGGSIFISFEEKPCDRVGYGAFVTTVSDTGIGMSKEFVEHIFEAFSREYNSTESKILGTGLGMAIVKLLVDIMGGKIEVESEVGKGSTFRVTNYHRFAEAPDEVVIDSSKKKSGCLKGKSILLAEDNDLNAEIAITILEECGFKIDHAKDGVEVVGMLNKAEDNLYDLILMDIQMPNMNGIDATKKIRMLNNDIKSKIPIIAMTANAFEEDKKAILEAGMNGFIPKPIDVPALLNEIERVLL